MKKIILLSGMTLLLVTPFIYAQEKNSFAVGLNINQFQNDFGLGVHVISPYFANNSVADKIQSKPIYSNGFIVSTGLRLRL